MAVDGTSYRVKFFETWGRQNARPFSPGRDKIEPGPESLGFDHHFMFPATNDRMPCVYIENGRIVNLDPADPITVSYRGRIPDSFPGTKWRVPLAHRRDHETRNGDIQRCQQIDRP